MPDKFTAGPWVIVPNDTYARGFDIEAEGERTVARFCTEANALLISCAPELLAVCREVAGWRYRDGDNVIVDKARAAIAGVEDCAKIGRQEPTPDYCETCDEELDGSSHYHCAASSQLADGWKSFRHLQDAIEQAKIELQEQEAAETEPEQPAAPLSLPTPDLRRLHDEIREELRARYTVAAVEIVLPYVKHAVTIGASSMTAEHGYNLVQIERQETSYKVLLRVSSKATILLFNLDLQFLSLAGDPDLSGMWDHLEAVVDAWPKSENATGPASADSGA
jgi:hypothetical protein